MIMSNFNQAVKKEIKNRVKTIKKELKELEKELKTLESITNCKHTNSKNRFSCDICGYVLANQKTIMSDKEIKFVEFMETR